MGHYDSAREYDETHNNNNILMKETDERGIKIIELSKQIEKIGVQLETEINRACEIENKLTISESSLSLLSNLMFDRDKQIESMKNCGNCASEFMTINEPICGSCYRSRIVRLKCMTKDNWKNKK